nr:glycoside hydrolase family 15 protein [Streptomyces roseolus]
MEERDGYLPIADHGLLGDGRGSALVGRNGAVSFMCVPRFDSPPLFCGLLDAGRGGRFLIAPADLHSTEQWYVEDTAVLITRMYGTRGVIEVTDTFLLRPESLLEEDVPAGIGALARRVRVVAGSVDLRVLLQPRGGAQWKKRTGSWLLSCPRQGLSLHLSSSRPLPGLDDCTLPMRSGEELALKLSWDGPLPASAEEVDTALNGTIRAWRRWTAQVVHELPQAGLVRRSAITLKLLDYVENGAVIAAPTSSLPEFIGGSRNWDYRYTWIRDAAYTVFALRRIGLPMEAGGFLDWALTTARWSDDRPRVLYGVDGLPPQPETIDEQLEGYRGSAPVRWGNAAVDQIQHDVYGEILDCAFQWAATGGRLGGDLWNRLAVLVEQARRAWRTPDRGIWEVRTAGRPFTYSAAMCQVALDRAARLARRLGMPGDADGWATESKRLTDRILREAWDEDAGALTEHLGPGGGLDASLLALPLRRVVPADHPRMIATSEAVAARLGAGGGLLHRYLPVQSPDGLGQPEGAFVLCSFWLVDNLAGQGRTDEAAELFDKLCSYASPLGLLGEEIDPTTGDFLGNFPQALSHVGLVSSAVVLGRVQHGVRPELSTQAWFS